MFLILLSSKVSTLLRLTYFIYNIQPYLCLFNDVLLFLLISLLMNLHVLQHTIIMVAKISSKYSIYTLQITYPYIRIILAPSCCLQELVSSSCLRYSKFIFIPTVFCLPPYHTWSNFWIALSTGLVSRSDCFLIIVTWCIDWLLKHFVIFKTVCQSIFLDIVNVHIIREVCFSSQFDSLCNLVISNRSCFPGFFTIIFCWCNTYWRRFLAYYVSWNIYF